MKTNATVYGYPVNIHREGQWYVIDVPGVGVTQAKTEAAIALMVLDLMNAHKGEAMTPDLSDYERGVVERIEAAPAAEESLRERVARAIENACGDEATWQDLADVAIAVIRGAQ